MKISFNEKLVAYLTLFSGLTISAVAIYYSVTGLTAIFAGAVIPIIIMGVVLEVSKIIASVWLKQNWKTAPGLIKLYLSTAVAVLMLITSTGIFGFLSQAHISATAPSAEVAASIAMIDDQIATQKGNIETTRHNLSQLDASVDQALSRSSNERGAVVASTMRKAQSRERASLQSEIVSAQKNIGKLNAERAPIASQLRKVEAEVGPIKYIAAFFYGVTDSAILEKAVTWVIILIIVVFDPLALILLIASQISFQQFRARRAAYNEVPTKPELVKELYDEELDDDKVYNDPIDEVLEEEIATTSTNTATNFNTGYSTNFGSDFGDPVVDYSPFWPVSSYNQTEIKLMDKKPAAVIEPVAPVTMIKSSAPGSRVKVFPANSTYVQNEEQAESGLWQTTSTSTSTSTQDTPPAVNISYADYAAASHQRVDYYVNMVKRGEMRMDEVPEPLQAEVKTRV